MKKYLLILLCLLTVNAFAQNVGIGTLTPDASAQLDISSISKGLLIPRMTQSRRDMINLPANSQIGRAHV